MAIHPEYANAILDGTKRVEFRKRRLASDIQVVLLYATSPVQRILGLFTIEDTVAATPGDLWEEFAHVGGIDEQDFLRYFADAEVGIGLVVKAAHRLPVALTLDCLRPRPTAPQSFSYLQRSAVSDVVGSPSLAACVNPSVSEVQSA